MAGPSEWVENTRDHHAFPRAEAIFASGLYSGFGFPVLVGRQVAAVLEFYTTDSARPDERLFQVMEALPKGPTGKILKRAIDADAVRAASEAFTATTTAAK